MTLSEVEQEYFNNFLSTQSESYLVNSITAGIAGNNEIADELLNLYLSGKKTAGSGLVKDYTNANEPLPQVNDHWIILNSNKVPKCIVKVIAVKSYQFQEVPEEVAIAEGEGDLSLKYWREAHKDFFTPFLEQLEINDLNTAEVVCEFFELVYK